MFLGRRVAVYRIDEFLGEGGFAYVYRARDENLDIDVALKVLKPAFAYDEVFEENFRREAHRAAKFRHPNVVAIHYAGKDDDVVFFSMDLLETGLKDAIDNGRSLDDSMIIKVGMDVASALQFAHTHEGGIVHRDLKPDNILFDRHGNAVVTDFGIAEAATSYTAATGTTVYVGTPKYMSPEQARGQRVDHRSDIYSLGVTLYEMAVGDAPFSGRDWFELGRKHIEEMPTLPRAKNARIDSELERIILKCLQKDPADRYQRAENLRAELATLAGGTQGTVVYTGSTGSASRGAPSEAPPRPEPARPAPPEDLHEATTRPPKKRRKGLWVTLALMAALGGLGAAYATDTGGLRSLAETELPTLANLPFLGTGQVYATSFWYRPVEGGADINGDFDITFNAPIDPATANRENVRLLGPDGRRLPAEISVRPDGERITVVPANTLDYETEYSIVITAGLLSGTGNPIFQSPRAEEPGAKFAFSTRLPPPDTDPPALAESTPARGARNAAVDAPITLGFDEALEPESVNSASLRLLDSQGNPVQAEVLLRSDFRTALIQPMGSLQRGARYTVQLAGSIRDRAGNRMPADSFSFVVGGRPAPPKPLEPATMNVNVLPTQAIEYVVVQLDGEIIGSPPLGNVEIGAGQPHVLKLIATVPYSQHQLVLHEETFSAQSGGTYNIRREVRPFGSITLGSEPVADVFVDGKYVGSTPLAGYPLYAGSHKLELQPTGDAVGDYGVYTSQFELGPFEQKRFGSLRLPRK